MKEKDVPTKEKVTIPLRISNELYKKVREKVYKKKNKSRGYSINKYIAELIENNIEGEKINGNK